jgi:glutamine synthetase
LELATTTILPAALRYQTELAVNAASLQAIGYEFDPGSLDEVTAGIAELQSALGVLRAALAHEHDGGSGLDHAGFAGHELVPATLAVRSAADRLEDSVADNLWPLPTYQEMLYIL